MNQNQRIFWLPDDNWAVKVRLAHIYTVDLMLLLLFRNSSNARSRLFIDMNKIEPEFWVGFFLFVWFWEIFFFSQKPRQHLYFWFRKKMMLPTLYGSRKQPQKNQIQRKNILQMLFIAVLVNQSNSICTFLHLALSYDSKWRYAEVNPGC